VSQERKAGDFKVRRLSIQGYNLMETPTNEQVGSAKVPGASMSRVAVRLRRLKVAKREKSYSNGELRGGNIGQIGG